MNYRRRFIVRPEGKQKRRRVKMWFLLLTVFLLANGLDGTSAEATTAAGEEAFLSTVGGSTDVWEVKIREGNETGEVAQGQLQTEDNLDVGEVAKKRTERTATIGTPLGGDSVRGGDVDDRRGPEVNGSIFDRCREGNATTSNTSCNATSNVNETELTDGEEIPEWSRIFDVVQLASTSVGFFANILTLITLYVSPAGFSRLILLLFRHQSLVDSWVCAMASVVMLQPFHWLSGNKYIDVLICHAWHGQAFYWGAVTLSTYNLVIISFERYMAVLHPFKHAKLANISRKQLVFWFAFLYVLCLVITHGTYIQTRMKDGECVNEYAFDGPVMKRFFSAFVIFTYITTYFLPAVIMGTAYGIISRKLHARQKDTNLGQSNLIDRAGAQVTKTAITVTVIFIVSIGYDLHYYLLGHTGAAVYELNTPYQKVGVFLSNLNSCANPFVYAIIMPIFRLSMLRTFCCRNLTDKSNKSKRYAANVQPNRTVAASSSVSTIATDISTTSNFPAKI